MRFTPFLFSIALVFGACTSKKSPVSGEAGAKNTGPKASRGLGKEPTASELGGQRDTLVIATPTGLGSLMGPVQQIAQDQNISTNIDVTPMNATLDCSLSYTNELYEQSSWSEDGLIYKVRLRKDIKWSDSVPVSTKDIALAYDMIADPNVASPRLVYIEDMVEGKRPLIIDDHNLEFHYKKRYNLTTMVAHASSVPPVPHHKLKDADRATLRGHPLGTNPLSTGPFVVKEVVPESKIVLEANPNYSGPEAWKARLERVIFKVIPEYATRLVELENGSVDYVENVLPADADRLSKNYPNIKIRRRGMRVQDYLAWNLFDPGDYKSKKSKMKAGELDWATVKKHPLFGEKGVRKALSTAINVQKLIDDLLTSKVSGEAYAQRAVSTVTPALCDTHNNDLKPIEHNVEASKKLFAEAGWTDSNNDGLLDKGGKTFEFTMLTNSGNPRRAKAAIIIQANLKEVGVKMNIEKMEATTFFERLRKKDYDSALAGWAAALFVDMSSMWQSGDKYEFNFTGYNNPKVDALMAQALEEVDEAKSNVLWKEVQALIFEDQPYTFLYWMDSLIAMDSRFEDAQVNMLSPIHHLRSWWVPGDKVKYKKR